MQWFKVRLSVHQKKFTILVPKNQMPHNLYIAPSSRRTKSFKSQLQNLTYKTSYRLLIAVNSKKHNAICETTTYNWSILKVHLKLTAARIRLKGELS